ncbi:uncharacterized protein VTP21DRAFT_11411 [Calcarisporiella thermophila]|uniref:uncharacterized protein n=1 Tax=Calcarisporiella thermophila TaxID=911321 RepID=UPI003744AF34
MQHRIILKGIQKFSPLLSRQFYNKPKTRLATLGLLLGGSTLVLGANNVVRRTVECKEQSVEKEGENNKIPRAVSNISSAANISSLRDHITDGNTSKGVDKDPNQSECTPVEDSGSIKKKEGNDNKPNLSLDNLIAKLSEIQVTPFDLDLPEFPSLSGLKERLDDWSNAFPAAFEAYREAYQRIYNELSMGEGSLFSIIKEKAKNVELYPEIEWDATVRISNDLCHQERAFASARRKNIKRHLAKFIGVPENELHDEDIPVIGIAASGGGYRAALSTLGFLKAMKSVGFFDCAMYVSGVSGSCWCLSRYFSTANADFERLLDQFKRQLYCHPVNFSHFLKVVSSIPANELVLSGIVHRVEQGQPLSLVEMFGTLLSSVFFTETVAKNAKEIEIDGGERKKSEELEVKPLTDFSGLKISSQRRFVDDGSEPLPIYTVVRHEIPGQVIVEHAKDEEGGSDSMKKEMQENAHAKTENIKQEQQSSQEDDYYQWFEITPYEVGCEEFGAWVPTWGFGRSFDNGKNVERVPELGLNILLGLFGSAFSASLAHYYEEVRALLPGTMTEPLDAMVKEFVKEMGKYHPISPACFPNPFYHVPLSSTTPESVSLSPNLCLMDAGVDNNLPFYPLLREGRDVDVIVALDSSNDITNTPWFERAEGYALRRGIKGWPVGAGWPKEEVKDALESEEKRENNRAEQDKLEEQHVQSRNKMTSPAKGILQEYGLGYVTTFVGEAEETTVEDLSSTEMSESRKESIQKPITVVYFPLIPNEKVKLVNGEASTPDASAIQDEEANLPPINPQLDSFCSTWSFEYKPHQVEALVHLGETNFMEGLEELRKVVRTVWEKKRERRLRMESATNGADV